MNWEKPKVYAVKHLNDDIVALSRSGGVFTAFTDYVLNNRGIIYGCILSDVFEAIHVRTENAEVRDLMRGSKYVQSKIGDSYIKVREDLQNGRLVLFSGTSCQVAGLKKFLGKDYENLICIDIVCHGVPSPRVWREYLLWQQQKAKSKVRKVDFRNKNKYGWRAHIETLYFENGKIINSDVYKQLFYEHYILRPSCYECHYKSTVHPGDITIADYWGIEKAAPEYDDDKGVSLVLINNEAGQNLFDSIKNQIAYKKTRIEDSMQLPLIEPFPCPPERDIFWQDLNKKGFFYIVEHYCEYGMNYRVKNILKRIKRKIVHVV